MLQQSMKNGQEIDDVSLHMMTKVTIARSAGAEREDIAQGAQEFLDTLLSEYGQATWSDPGNYQGNLVHLLTGHVLTVSMWGVALNTEPFEKRCKKTLDVLLSHGVPLNDAYPDGAVYVCGALADGSAANGSALACAAAKEDHEGAG